jgi:hypothetical protein
MKNKIYIAVATLLLLSIVLILGFYYTQDFTEELDFQTTVNFADITIKSNLNNEVSYLSEASASLGTLKLENNGYFTQKYSAPSLTGCLMLKESSNGNVQFSIVPSTTYSPSTTDGQITIKVGEKREYNLIGHYSKNYRYSYPLSELTRENIIAVKVYELPKNNDNPLSNNYDYRYGNDYYYGDTSCEYLVDNETPLSVIAIS